ncbi:MAG: hypothetical protein PHW01_02290 [Patescibacteria group bacterium]|nr:hypothetical protein [Patescibacteria group bacterium]
MRKILISMFVLVCMMAFTGIALASNTASWTFDIKVQVQPWIQKNSGNPSLMKMADLEQDKDKTETTFGWYESFYSNVPFTKTFTGTNPAGDAYPIFAREERAVGGAGLGTYDRLSTRITFETVVNGILGGEVGRDDQSAVFNAGTQNSAGVPAGTGWTQGGFDPNVYSNPNASITFGTPHDGEVWEKFFVKADRKMPDYATDNAWYQSADAGIYALTITETLVGQNTVQSSDAYEVFP